MTNIIFCLHRIQQYALTLSQWHKTFIILQWRRKLVKLKGAENKILVQGGHIYVSVFIAYIADNTGTILAVILL